MPQAALGKYELVERLATGGMAELFLARARGPAGVRKTVVVKRIKPELAEDPRFVNLFINEARIGVQLNHPNIVQVYELARSGGTWFIAMELVDGRDLMQIQRRLRSLESSFPVEAAVFVAAELARGLHHAHSRTDESGEPLGLIHQDVSPHNVLVGFDGEVKLVDFGIARVLDRDGGTPSDSVTPAGRGKFTYASPEMLGGREVDARSDLYSAGVLLWELLACKRPFQGLGHAERVRRLQDEGLPPLQRVVPALDPVLSGIVGRCTALDPDDRYPSAAVLEEDLRAWLYAAGTRSGPADLAAVLESVFPDGRRHRPGLSVDAFARDLARLEASERPERTPASRTLPGRLQQSPGERKQVAVLVVDVDGLTELSARLEPERFFRRQFRLLRWVRRIVDAWGGTLQRAIDDHLFILFGVPRNREDDLSRAMDCALELQRRREELVGKGLSLEFCIGLHAGEVTIGAGRARVQYMARGNTTRLARRLSATADHGEILVSDRVVSQMAADFRLAQGPGIPSRGGRAALPSYRLEGRREGIRLARRGPWLRRGPEIEQLRHAVEGLQRGEGTTLAIVGPVGAGKTRLIEELQVLAQRRRIPFHAVRDTAWGGHPFRGFVHGIFHVERDAPVDEVVASLAEASAIGLSDREVEALEWLVGLPVPITPERAEWVSALERLMRGICEDGAAILSLETGGMRPSDLDLLLHLLGRISDCPLLTLIVTRPPLPAALESKVRVVQIQPFDREAQQRLVRTTLDVETVPERLLDLVHATSEGNPLYIQEIVKVLLDRGDLVVAEGAASLREGASLELPDTLHGLIASRIDALDAASKGILQLASVIGPSFAAPLLARAAGLDDPSPLLLELEAAGLVVRTEEAWAFTTELVREAAARGILGVQRRDYHRLISEALESTYAEHLEPWFDDLAEHCARGGRWLDAARYARESGAALEKAGRLDEARARFQRGLTWLASAIDPDDHDARIQGEAMLNLQAGSLSLMLGDVDRGKRAVTLALDIASDAGLPWIEARAHLALGRRYLAEGKHRLASAHLSMARSMAGSEDDPKLELEAYEASAALALDQGRPDAAEELWRQVLECAADAPVLSARCQSGLATLWLRAGETDRAVPMLQSALTAARMARDRILEGRVLNNIGLVHSLRGEHDEALVYYRRALEVREGIGYTRGMVINHHNIGDVHFQRGSFLRAHVAFQRSHELATRTDWARGQVLNEVFLAYLDAHFGRASADRLEEVRVRARALEDPTTATTALWLRGRLHLEHDELDQAEAVLQAALDEAKVLGLAPVQTLVQRTLDDL